MFVEVPSKSHPESQLSYIVIGLRCRIIFNEGCIGRRGHWLAPAPFKPVRTQVAKEQHNKQ